MAYAIVHYFAGGTQAQYDAALPVVHPSADELPDGQIFHVAGPSQDGWMVVAVHESKESWERFRDEELQPGLQSVEGTFESPPEETPFDVHTLLP